MRLSRARALAALGAVVVVVVVVAAVVAVLVLPGSGSGRPATPPGPAAGSHATGARAPTGSSSWGVTASWVQQENAKPGSPFWVISGAPATGRIEGFADQVYAAQGQHVRLFLNTTAASFHVEAYRVGWYGGAGARLVWRSGVVAGTRQAACPVTPGINEASCAGWSPSLTVPITAAFVQGDYLFKLVGAGNEQSYVPLTVWDPASTAAYLVKNDVYTWQAWNPYGGYDFYQGIGSCPPGVYPTCTRARVVSYDRPYGYGEGAGDFLTLEAPLVRFLEQHGLDVAYATDLTILQHPDAVDRDYAVLSLAHDECWSEQERVAVQTAHDTHGVNVAFFGASGMLRHVRSQDSPLGPGRLVVDYRDASADPLNGRGDPRQVTGNTWSAPPASWPESPFVGSAYNGYLAAGTSGGLTVSDASSWLFTGTGLANGTVLPGVIGSDVDALEVPQAVPADVQVVAHSPLSTADATAASRQGAVFYSDMTWWTDPQGQAGVWDSGTNNWIPALAPGGAETPTAAAAVQRITGNLLAAIGPGPAGRAHPSVGDAGQYYPGRP